MTPKKKCTIVISVIVAGIVLTLIGAIASIDDPVYLGVAVALFIAAIVLQVKFYRCPHCNRYLGKRFYTEAFCPHCHKVMNPELVPAKTASKKNNRHHKKKK